ncbi:MAG: hypothetical protein HY078_16200 [Elusimicrobia bacterium]|nr:hypothetical protein [Elusimicrobiota bacterium]
MKAIAVTCLLALPAAAFAGGALEQLGGASGQGETATSAMLRISHLQPGAKAACPGVSDPAASGCKAVEFAVRSDRPGAQGWYDMRPRVAYREFVSDRPFSGPSPDGRLWICENASGPDCLFGPPKKYDRVEDQPEAIKKFFYSEGWIDEVRLLAKYPWPEVKKILTGARKDCSGPAVDLAKAEDRRLHPEDYEGQPSDFLIHTSYGKNGYRERTLARLEGNLEVHEVQTIHFRSLLVKLDDYAVTLDPRTCALAAPIAAGGQYVHGWARDGRRRATLKDFLEEKPCVDRC